MTLISKKINKSNQNKTKNSKMKVFASLILAGAAAATKLTAQDPKQHINLLAHVQTMADSGQSVEATFNYFDKDNDDYLNNQELAAVLE